MEFPMRDIRRVALQKIALLSAESSSHSSAGQDLDRLCKLCPSRQARPQHEQNGIPASHTPVSKVPMSVRELETLLALCKAAPLLNTIESAERLLRQLSPYLLEAHTQAFALSPFLRTINPSPWEALSHGLCSALLAIGVNHPSLGADVHDKISYYLEQCLSAVTSISLERIQSTTIETSADHDDALDVATITVSLLGFLEAAASYANFWSTPARLQLIVQIKRILSEELLISAETAFSAIRNSHASYRAIKDWRRYARHYAAIGRPLGAMLLQRSLVRFIVSSTSLLVADIATLRGRDILDVLVSDEGLSPDQLSASKETVQSTVETLTDILVDEMGLLEEGADFLQLGTTWQQRLAFAVKAGVLTSYLNCTILEDEVADADTLMSWLEDTMADTVQMSDETLAHAVLRCTAILAKRSPAYASNLSRSLPRFIVQGGLRGTTVATAADCLAHVLQQLSQDAVITTLYTLGNVLSASSSGENPANGAATPNGSIKVRRHFSQQMNQTTGSAISLTMHGEEETSVVYGNVVQTIVGVARKFQDEKITALAQSMLIQKIGKISVAVDARIISEAAAVAATGGPTMLKSVLRLYTKLSHDSLLKDSQAILQAIRSARNQLSLSLSQASPLRDIYLVHLLETVISKGDIHESESSREVDIELAAFEIGELLQPLALLVSSGDVPAEDAATDELEVLYRDAWFNIVVHGFNASSELGSKYHRELRLIATHSRPLIIENRADQLESDIELNTVLRRGMSAQRAAEERKLLSALLPTHETEIRTLNYPKVIFLRAAYLLESLRADSGDCSKILVYFRDPALKSGDMGGSMIAICDEVMSIYIRKSLLGMVPEFSAACISKQLAAIFAGCCHRVVKVQTVAASCADRIIKDTPSALCQRSSLFALLELLSIMWSSCLEAETDEYEWRSRFSSSRGNVTVELSDNYALRRATLDALYRRARGWVLQVMNVAPLDVKGLLQTYLSEYDDDGAYGHVSLGRSFAVEMGSVVPSADQKLSAIDRHGECNINTASDFVAQYTTRQEYRFADALPEHDQDWIKFMHLNAHTTPLSSRKGQVEDAATILTHLEARTKDRKFVSIGELRDILRRAAALLCRSKTDQSAIIHHLVGIPFAIFNKQSIKLGVSLWMGIINENPRMGTRILMEIASNWECTVRRKVGIFDDRNRHLDPFYVKQEFAPSDKETIMKKQQAALNVIGPHLRILQFLVSHFNATRLGSPHIQKAFHRLVRITLDGLKHATVHPLAREVHFQIILFGLRFLRFSTGLDVAAQVQLKEQILSGALRWFSAFPRWSFGGNRLQIKTETHLLADVEDAVQSIAHIGLGTTQATSPTRSKQELLLILLRNEQSRLMVWLFPLDQDRRHFLPGHSARAPGDAIIAPLVKTAWNESPGLALQLINRFQSPRIVTEVRWLLLNFPQRAISEPDALQILLGSSLPNDITFQLKYLLYWAPVNPVTAVTYFLQAYGNHPYILQYAVRALETHSVDITFFYVPQIVQTLRYDALGYVQRYIIETAKFSQLFAHQIIWNMKANAFKDEDSQIPDSVKPKLDTVTTSLISSFSSTDRQFYEREFSFFNEITDISGKLRPYIKKPKPEKKQKIEEELRKIKVEVGVYLPSNPEGVVIGIDRKSGKPLQSHAKAPYMATFRIRKNIGDMESTEGMLEDVNYAEDDEVSAEQTIEVWQSAIFKVGDDCRQDVLALQMIAAFRGIFNNVGLDVYVYPYRVTATAPGCGVIDVLPNSISRDMLGREAVNGLYDYFVTKYGGEDSIRFQEARNNFVKSMAPYSVISYLLQFKDRHNGNIMLDEAGHILHIDFGFCFDIAPGGVKFERAPFKLTSEMVAVMGGNTDSQSYHWFEELCIKAFLASRAYVEKLVHVVILMLDSGLPCFKPETIQHFRDRFVLGKTDREAADFMRDLIKKSHSSYSTGVYDQFQLLTNGIPY